MRHHHKCHGANHHHHRNGKPHGRRGFYERATDGVAKKPGGNNPRPSDALLKTPSRGRLGVTVDTEKCVGCRKCEKICPTGAVAVTEAAVIHSDKCRGCGQCIEVCPQNAISWL